MNEEYGAPERKFHRPDKGLVVSDGHVVEGYASLFGKTDQGGDIVQKGAYAASLERLAAKGGRVKMLWQRECLKLCVSDRAHAVFRYGQASKRPANIMAS